MLAPGRFPIAFHLRREFKEKLQNTPVNWEFKGLSEFGF